MEKVKQNNLKIGKRIMAMILVLITLLGNLSSVFATEGTGTWIGTQYPSYFITTDTSQTIGICLRKLVNSNTGEEITAFCSEHGKEFYSGVKYDGSYYTPTSVEMKKACKIAYLGWYSKYGNYVVGEEVVSNSNYGLRMDFAFTQQYIWETIAQTDSRFIDSGIQSQYENFKANIDSQINNIEQRPSFNNSSIVINVGEPITINDDNGVLANYKSVDTTIDNIKIIHNQGDNSLTLEALLSDCKVENFNLTEDMAKSIGLIKAGTENYDTTIYIDLTEGTQDQLYAMHYDEEVALALNININLFGNLEINKTNTNGDFLDGASFKVTNDNGYEKEITVEKGKALIEQLPIGKYYIQEISAPKGYIINSEKYEVEVKANETVKQTITDEKPTGTIEIEKSIIFRADMDTSIVNTKDLSGIKFKLLAKENIIDTDGSVIYKKGEAINTYSLDKTGNLKITKLPMGKYEIQEIKTLDGLVLDNTKYEVEFSQKDDTTKVYKKKLEISNETTILEFSKQDITGDKELEGAELTVLDEKNNIMDSWISTSETHKIEGLTANKTYILRENLAPIGYTKSTDVEFTVKNTNEIQKVIMIDKVVEMSKVDISGEELEGATMQVIDKNNFIVDEWVSTKEPHKIQGLIENETYILHEEVAIDGYVKASDMEFTVTEDKETQKVEMIDKVVEVTKTDLTTSEEIEGAELEVTDKDGNIVDSWTSTKEAHRVQGLEEGSTYTLTETIAPDGYEVAESITFTVSTDKETQKIEMKDRRIVKETPKTGDTRKTVAYAVLFIIATGSLIIVTIKNKKENDKE